MPPPLDLTHDSDFDAKENENPLVEQLPGEVGVESDSGNLGSDENPGQSSSQSGNEGTASLGEQVAPTESAVENDEQAAPSLVAFESSDKVAVKNADEALVAGWQATYEAEVLLPDDVSLQWQVTNDGATWVDIEGQTTGWYTFDVVDDTFLKWFRVAATSTDPDSGAETTHYSPAIRPVKAVCYVESSRDTAARASGTIEGFDSLQAAFDQGQDNDHENKSIVITITSDIVIDNPINVYSAQPGRLGQSRTNTYTLKSADGQGYSIAPSSSFVGNTLFQQVQNSYLAYGTSNMELVLQNIVIDSSGKTDNLVKMVDNKGWLYVQGGAQLLNPGKAVVDYSSGAEFDSFKINSGQADTAGVVAAAGPIKIDGAVVLPDASQHIRVFGPTGNFTSDTDIVLSSGSSSYASGTQLVEYSSAPDPREVAYFRLQNPGTNWLVAGSGGLSASDARPSTVYLGSTLADGSTVPDPYAAGSTPDEAVGSLSTAYAKVRQLNNEGGAQEVDLCIVGKASFTGSYAIAPTSFEGEGEHWTWNEAHPTSVIKRYYRPTGKAPTDPGYSKDSYNGVLFQVDANANARLSNMVVDGKPVDTEVTAAAQAPLIQVENGASVYLSGSTLKNNQNAAADARGGAAFLADGSTMTLHDSAIVGNTASGQGAGLYQSPNAVLKIQGSYTTEDSQQIWLAESGAQKASLAISAPFAVQRVSSVPLGLADSAYVEGRVVALYEESPGLDAPNIAEAEKFELDAQKLAGAGLYITYSGRNILLRQSSGDIMFGFTKKDAQNNTLEGVTFRLYECRAAEGNHNHSPYADLYGNDAGNCWHELVERTSGADGQMIFGYLPDGEYRLAEITAPYGNDVPYGQWRLEINSAAQTKEDKVKLTFMAAAGDEAQSSAVVLNEAGTSVDVAGTTITNNAAKTVDLNLTVRAADSSTSTLSGISFELYSCDHWRNGAHVHEHLATPEVVQQVHCWCLYTQNGNTGSYTTNANGALVISGLMDGDYMLKQVNAADGYQLPQGQWLIRVRNGEAAPITIIAKQGGNYLPGVSAGADASSFTLYNVSEVEPPHQKTIKYNGQGEYTLNLDVTGTNVPQRESKNPVSTLIIVEATKSIQGSTGSGMNVSRRQEEIAKELARRLLQENVGNEVAVISHGRQKSTVGSTGPFVSAEVVCDWTDEDAIVADAVENMPYEVVDNASSWACNWEAAFRFAQTMFGVADSAQPDYLPARNAPKAGNDRRIVFLTYNNASSFYTDTSRFGSTFFTNTGYSKQVFSQNDASKSGGRSYQDYAWFYLPTILKNTGATMDVVSLDAYSEYRYISAGYGDQGQKYRIAGTAPVLNEDLTNAGLPHTYTRAYAQAGVPEEEARNELYDKVYGDYSGVHTTQGQVVVSDTLSEYVDLIGADASAVKVSAKDADGNPVDLSGVNIVKAYDAAAKKLTFTFPAGYTLAQGVTYSFSFDVKVTEAAFAQYTAAGYNAMGDDGTDAPGNYTSSGKAGFFSNDEAKVSYTFAGVPREAAYSKPVVQVPVATFDILKTDAADSALPEATFDLYRKTSDQAEALAPGNGWEVVQQNLVTNEAGRVAVKGLRDGVYRLVESAAPLGYKTPTGQWELTVKAQQRQPDGSFADSINVMVVSGADGTRPPQANYDAGTLTVKNEKAASAYFDFEKVDAQDTSKTIDGAVFQLYACTKNHQHEHLVTQHVVDGGACWKLVTEKTSGAELNIWGASMPGYVDFGELPAADYMLVEAKTAPGYQLPRGQWQIAVNDDGSLGISGIPSEGSLPPAFIAPDGSGATGVIEPYKLPNMKDFQLPFAGSGGLSLFVVIGFGLMAAAAAAYLHFQRRRTVEKGG